MSNETNSEGRIIVLVCSKCKKLIGTRENFHLVRKPKSKLPYAVECEGCHVDK
jgi:hypothetical protein